MKILVLFASKSDDTAYKPVLDMLKKEKIEFDFKIYSAHKTPNEVEEAIQGDYSVIITGAGLAAALPGVVAAKTIRPVIGVPCKGNYEGLDALLSIVQMPSGIPVLAVGVNKGNVAASGSIKMLKGYDFVNITGNKSDKAVSKAVEILKSFNVPYRFSESADKSAVNIEFVHFDEPLEEKEELVIYCPMRLEKDDRAEASLSLLKHSSHGLWVGMNNGANAAIAAVEILNLNNQYEEQLLKYRAEMAEKFKEYNK